MVVFNFIILVVEIFLVILIEVMGLIIKVSLKVVNVFIILDNLMFEMFEIEEVIF